MILLFKEVVLSLLFFFLIIISLSDALQVSEECKNPLNEFRLMFKKSQINKISRHN